MGNYGNTTKIIDAEREQSRTVKRYGKCEYCQTQINTNLLKDEDMQKFRGKDDILDCPICNSEIKMELI